MAIYKPGFKDGHSITAYGVETVTATESRILVYDNNYPNLREYITVDKAANTWRYGGHAGESAGRLPGDGDLRNAATRPAQATRSGSRQVFRRTVRSRGDAGFGRQVGAGGRDIG